MATSTPPTPFEQLIAAATYAVADLRTLAAEASETDPRTSPALRAAERLAQAVVAAKANLPRS